MLIRGGKKYLVGVLLFNGGIDFHLGGIDFHLADDTEPKAAELVAFRLMPPDPQSRKFEANWSFNVLDIDRHMAAFRFE